MLDGQSETRIYVPGELVPGRSCALPSAQAHHALSVLRMKPGETVTLFNGDGAEYDAVIEAAAKRAVSVKIGARRAAVRESGIRIELGQALSSEPFRPAIISW
jgi:16S rRNA (uracil1498-N3)-methyltransferase